MKNINFSWFKKLSEIYIDSWHTLNNRHLNLKYFLSQKAQVHVKSQITGIKVLVEL